MHYLISYDISHNYQRQKIAEKLIESGFDRIQYSVYMGTVEQERMKILVDWLQERVRVAQGGTSSNEATQEKKTRSGLRLNLEIFKSILPKSMQSTETAPSNKRKTNSLIILKLNRNQVKDMVIMGDADIDPEEITGEKTTLIF